jgi:hypothetical protein
VLDICFGENQIRCLPAAIGTAARTAYQKRVDACLFANKAMATEESNQSAEQSPKYVTTASGHHHQANNHN